MSPELPGGRIVDRAAGREKLAREGRCRLCRQPWPLERAHLVRRSQGGDDFDANLLPLCHACHRAVDTSLAARARLRPRLQADEVRYVLLVKSAAWLDRVYPPAPPAG